MQNVRLDLDSLTKAKYERGRKYYTALERAEMALESRLGENGHDVCRDVFGAVYAPNTGVDSETDGTPMRRILDWATTQLAQLPDWAELQAQGQGSIITASLATEVLAEYLAGLEWPSPEQKPDQKPDQKAGKGTKAKPGLTQEQLAAFAGRLESDPLAGALFQGGISGKIAEAVEEAEETNKMLAMCYGMQGTENIDTEDETVAELVNQKRNSRALNEFLKHIGRFMDALKTSPVRQRVRGNVMPYDISTTRDFRRLVPSELAMLAHPATRAMQTVRVVSGQALGWQMADMGSKGRGPMHVALDVSASMQIVEVEAKAFAVAAAFSAADNNRPVSFSVFTTESRNIADNLETPENRVKLLQDIMRIRCSGGTNFCPLINRIQKLESSADVLLISDGDGHIIPSEAESAFSNRALHYLVIGDSSSMNNTLRTLSEGRTLLASSLAEGSVTDFASNATAAR